MTEPELDAWLDGRPGARPLFEAVRGAIAGCGEASLRVSKAQVAFRRKRAFAWIWRPDDWLHGHHAPLVLTVGLRRRDASPRWKEVVEPRPGRFTHHLELHAPADVDAEARAWLAEAWAAAG